MTKYMLAIATAMTLTSLSILPAAAQCMRNQCPPSDSGGGNASDCDGSLTFLPRVYAEQVAAISDKNRIWITELCTDFSKLSSEGNAAYLRPVIAKNKVLMSALRGRAFSVDDVFAVQMMGSDATINLYVHDYGH